jgi:hypothetical protein
MSKDPKKLLKAGATTPRLEIVLMVLGIALVFFIAIKVLSPSPPPSPPATTNQATKP